MAAKTVTVRATAHVLGLRAGDVVEAPDDDLVRAHIASGYLVDETPTRSRPTSKPKASPVKAEDEPETAEDGEG